MRVPVSWLREYVDVPAGLDAEELERAFVRVGLEVEEISDLGGRVTGPLVVGRVLSIEELTGLKKPIRYCRVDVGGLDLDGQPTTQGIICGARNFAEGNLVVVALPGAVLPGEFAISARKTYGRMSEGMICSARELGVSDEHEGIMVLPPDSATPGAEARPLVGLDEVVVELNINPDRGYCFSVRGLARELAHSLGLPFRDPAGLVAPATPTAGTRVPGGEPVYPVQVRDPAGCDRFAVAVVRGVDPAASSPDWLRTRLVHAGMRPISLAVDVTNYLMLELGQPMHAFDLAALRGPLVVRRAVPGERLTTLDGAERVLDPADMVICDAGLPGPAADPSGGTPVSLAAVMGGATSEVGPATTDLLLEAAHWDPIMVARTARRHKLSSEAARRYERGVDPRLPLVALARAVELLTRHGGGSAEPDVLDLDHTVAQPTVTMAADLPARTAGVAYPPERVVELLTALGAQVDTVGDRLAVTPPSWRPDLIDPADLVEEVVRLDGYDNVPSVLPVAPPGGGLTATQRRRRSVGRALAEAGLVEVLSYPFVSAGVLDAMQVPADDPRRRLVRLRNPLSDEEPAMRSTLLPPLLSTLRRNLGRGLRDLALYELGMVFHPVPGAGLPPRMGVDRRPGDEELAAAEAVVPAQPWHVAAVFTGDVAPAGWWGSGRAADWSDAVEAARTVVGTAGATPTVRAGRYAPWHPGRCAELLVDGVVVGYAGELHPAVCDALELPRRTCAMEVDLDAVPLPGVTPAPQVSAYPPMLIDVALVVDATTPAVEVAGALRTGAGPLLESVRLFDVYAGEQVGGGRKSLAYKLVFRAPDRTLTGPEAVAARDAAVAVAADRFGAELRGV